MIYCTFVTRQDSSLMCMKVEQLLTTSFIARFSQFGEKTSGFSCQGGAQDFYTLRDRCIESGSLFEDPEFPASDRSLFYTRYAESGYEWKRPDLICGANDRPRFFEKGYSRFDVRQGKLGDCWFLAAAANLTQYDKLFSRVVCDDNSFEDKYAGIFHFRRVLFG